MAIATALLILALATPAAVYAAEHTVGGSTGWTQFGDYSTWASGEKFNIGDTLVFNYDSSSHKVAEVSKSDYDGCSSSNAIQTYNDGATTITLSKAGPMYFICPALGHCSGGMKLSINVESATTAPTTSPSTPATSPSTPSSTTTPSSPTNSSTTPTSTTTPASTTPAVSSSTPSSGSPPTRSTSTVSTPTGSNGAAGVWSSMNVLVLGSMLVLGTVVGFMG